MTTLFETGIIQLDDYICNNKVVSSYQKTGDNIILRLTGEIEMSCAMHLRQAMLDVIAPGKNIIINMADVTFMDSSGLAILIETMQLSKKQKSSLKIVAISPRVKNIFEISRLDSFFNIYSDEQEALI